ncbi:MAG: hypothetical protein C0600_05045 [Ignavibacteria bacterium]|nr:MAG: hypothetical protein C0600_05045 [Ignavibacteria bacterium]
MLGSFMKAHRSILLTVFFMTVVIGCERERIVDPGPDTTPPLPPADLLVESARDGYILMSWIPGKELDLLGYIVYRDEGSERNSFVPVDTVTTYYFIDEQRSYDTLYHYCVTAIDESGNESGALDTVSAQSPNKYAPEYPLQFSVNGLNDGNVLLRRLSWTASEEYDLAGYHVYRSSEEFVEADSSLRIVTTDATWFDDMEYPELGRRFHYAVSAVDRGGRESPLTRIESDYIAGRPLLVTPQQDGRAPSYPLLKWLNVPEASEYLVSVSLSEFTGELWTGYAPASASDTISIRYGGGALFPGNTYYWRVSSVTAANGRPNGISAARRFVVEN